MLWPETDVHRAVIPVQVEAIEGRVREDPPGHVRGFPPWNEEVYGRAKPGADRSAARVTLVRGVLIKAGSDVRADLRGQRLAGEPVRQRRSTKHAGKRVEHLDAEG